MHLSDIQSAAFATAEAKGLHASLLPDAPVTDREHALILLARLHQQLDTVTQLVKRHGITDEVCDKAADIFRDVRDGSQWLDWLPLHRKEGDLHTLTGCTHMSQSAATLIRLALAHTELSEASECIEDVNADITPVVAAKITEELADTLIRSADLAQTLGGNLDASTVDKLAYNKLRPHGFGTPLARESQ